jgi:hypothetical protein
MRGVRTSSTAVRAFATTVFGLMSVISIASSLIGCDLSERA